MAAKTSGYKLYRQMWEAGSLVGTFMTRLGAVRHAMKELNIPPDTPVAEISRQIAGGENGNPRWEIYSHHSLADDQNRNAFSFSIEQVRDGEPTTNQVTIE